MLGEVRNPCRLYEGKILLGDPDIDGRTVLILR
jgi:hypothetical protein